MLIPRMRTPAEMAELMKRQETIRPRTYSQFGSTAPAFFPETDEPLLVPHQTYYEEPWGPETAVRTGAVLRVHSAVGGPTDRTWLEEIETRMQVMRPRGRGEMGNPGSAEGYVAVPRRYVTELGRTDLPQVHEYVAVPRRYVTELGVPAVPPQHGYVAVPRRYVTGLGNATDVAPDPTAVNWKSGPRSAYKSEADIITYGLNMANLFGVGQVAVADINELLRGAILYTAQYRGDKKYPDLDTSPLLTKTYLPQADFNEKVRWGIAFVRFFLANPDRYQISYRERTTRWWRYRDFTGISNSLPPRWWS